jgi:phenylalanyl-tRNA synthetase alpha chain
MPSLIDKLQQLRADAEAAFQAAASADALEEARVRFLGAKQGLLKGLQKEMGSVAKGEKPAVGKLFNEVKNGLNAALEQAQSRMESSAAAAAPVERFDPTLPGRIDGSSAPAPLGRLHPITQTIEELKDIMGRLGFTAVEGPEIEDDGTTSRR